MQTEVWVTSGGDVSRAFVSAESCEAAVRRSIAKVEGANVVVIISHLTGTLICRVIMADLSQYDYTFHRAVMTEDLS